MGLKDIKTEARGKLALNMHQAIILYTIEYVLLVSVVALILMAVLCINSSNVAAVVFVICYSVVLFILVLVGVGVLSFAMVDYYLACYKCKPYNVRRLGDVLARNGVVKILMLNVRRTLFGFLFLLCLIVPGIIYLIRTSMAGMLLIANPKMKASTALSASNKVMSGKTGSYFSLIMSMFGWYVLGIFTLGLGLIFVLPYINLSKTVYYKRNLQGDKTVYKTVVQPVSPIQSAPQPVQPIQPQAANPVNKQTQPASNELVRPVQISNEKVPPIAALNSDDVAEMNATIRDLDGTPIPEVKEVPIAPVIRTNMQASSVTGNTPNDSKAAPQPDFEEGEHKIADSNLVERVTPLSTREIDESDVMKRKINAMFSGDKTFDQPQHHDYIGNMSNSNPGDFSDDFNDNEPVPETPLAAAEEEPIMSDEQFAEFIKNFDVPASDGEFKPLTRNPDKKPDPFAETPITPSFDDSFDTFGASSDTFGASFEKPSNAYVDSASSHASSSPFPSGRPFAAQPPHRTPTRREPPHTTTQNQNATSRLERIRREREERAKRDLK